jgi:hypothetical protein
MTGKAAAEPVIQGRVHIIVMGVVPRYPHYRHTAVGVAPHITVIGVAPHVWRYEPEIDAVTRRLHVLDCRY